MPELVISRGEGIGSGKGGGANTPRFYPPLREDIDLYPSSPQMDGSPTWVLHDPVSNRFLQIGWLEFEIISRWDLGDAAAIVALVNRETCLEIELEDVALVGQFLWHQQFLKPASLEALQERVRRIDAERGGIFKFLLHHYLFFRIPLFHPDTFLDNTLWMVRPFYSRSFALLVTLAGFLGIFLVLRQWDLFIRSSLALISWDSLVFYIAAVITAKCIHELSHAYACKLYGLNVPVIGIAFLVLWPFLYTDTGESWKLSSRRQRLLIVSAGMAAECTLAVFSTLAWTILSPGALRDICFFLATTSWLMTLAINVSPFMRWDGYYLLSDLTGIKNLQPRSMALAKWWLRELLFGFGDEPPEKNPPGRHRFMIAYAFAVWLYRAFIFFGIALLVYHFFIKLVGIFLMAVELGWFIWLPIQKELVVWYQKRGEMRWNRHSIASLVSLALLLLLIFLPWRGYLLLPAVEKPEVFVEFYPASPGQIVDVGHLEGTSVAAGDMLYRLVSPQLDQEIGKAALELERAKVLLQRSAAADVLREQREVAIEEFVKAAHRYDGLLSQQKRQTISAPFSGRLTRQGRGIRPGLWVAETTSLGLLVNEGGGQVVYAYALAEELSRITEKSEGMFYPERGERPPVPVRIRHISYINAEILPERILASFSGGPVRVNVNERGQYVPEQSIFQVQLVPRDGGVLEQVERGYVRIEAAPESFALRVWRNLHALFIRESGF